METPEAAGEPQQDVPASAAIPGTPLDTGPLAVLIDPRRGLAPQRRANGSRVTNPEWTPLAPVAAPATAPPAALPGRAADAGLEPLPWETETAAIGDSASLRSHKIVREVVETTLLAVLVFLAVRATFQNYRVEGHSMDPTLQDGEFLLVNKLEYSQINVKKLSNFIPFLQVGGASERDVFHGPQRGDIVVLKDPRDLVNEHLVKRVIGLPGETFEIANGHVYINGRLLDEPYITQPWDGSTPKEVIPAGDYFVMGDNRENSWDSRFFGLVPRSLIVGKAQLSYWPFSKFGQPAHASPKLADAVTRP